MWRYYDPGTGRYFRVDPIGMKGGINIFAYVHSNPNSYFDQLGLSVLKPCPLATANAAFECGKQYQEMFEAAKNEIDECQEKYKQCISSNPPPKWECEEFDKLKTANEALNWCKKNSNKWENMYSDAMTSPKCKKAFYNAIESCFPSRIPNSSP